MWLSSLGRGRRRARTRSQGILSARRLLFIVVSGPGPGPADGWRGEREQRRSGISRRGRCRDPSEEPPKDMVRAPRSTGAGREKKKGRVGGVFNREPEGGGSPGGRRLSRKESRASRGVVLPEGVFAGARGALATPERQSASSPARLARWGGGGGRVARRARAEHLRACHWERLYAVEQAVRTGEWIRISAAGCAPRTTRHQVHIGTWT